MLNSVAFLNKRKQKLISVLILVHKNLTTESLPESFQQTAACLEYVFVLGDAGNFVAIENLLKETEILAEAISPTTADQVAFFTAFGG